MNLYFYIYVKLGLGISNLLKKRLLKIRLLSNMFTHVSYEIIYT